MDRKLLKSLSRIDEVVTPEERKEYTAFSKKLKSVLNQKYPNLGLRVSTSGSVRPDPYIQISVKDWQTTSIPNELRTIAAKAIGANPSDWNDIHYGNIRDTYITLNHSQWVEVMKALEGGQTEQPVAESIKEQGAYNTMKGQAGGRMIISWKREGGAGVTTSHFASVEEFMEHMKFRNEKLEWYRIGNGEKIYPNQGTQAPVKEGEGTQKQVTLLPYEYYGFEGPRGLVWVDKDNKFPDPGRRMNWGRSASDPNIVVSDFQRQFSRTMADTATITYVVPPMTTASAEQKIRLEAIKKWITENPQAGKTSEGKMQKNSMGNLIGKINEEVANEATNDQVTSAFLQGATKGHGNAVRIEGDIFYSYATPIAIRKGADIYVDTTSYSVTTSRHRNLLVKGGAIGMPHPKFVELAKEIGVFGQGRMQEEYQPKTGEKCSCKPGIERDNCPSCEGTGMKIDFKKIRARNVKPTKEGKIIQRPEAKPTCTAHGKEWKYKHTEVEDEQGNWSHSPNLPMGVVLHNGEYHDVYVPMRESINEADAPIVADPEVPSQAMTQPDTEQKPQEAAPKPPESTQKDEQPEDIPPEGEKEYLGNNGHDTYFYLVKTPAAQDGVDDLQILDAGGKVLFSAKEENIEVGDVKTFIMQGLQKVDISNLSYDIVTKYLIPSEEEERAEKEPEVLAGDDKENTSGSASTTETPSTATPAGVGSRVGEAKVNEIDDEGPVSREQEIGDSFINGNISWVRNAIKKNMSLYAGVHAYLQEYAPDEARRFARVIGGVHEAKRKDEPLDPDSQEVADISKKYGFGSVAWQDAMIARIIRKLKNKEPLTGTDQAFIETQKQHVKHTEIADFEKSWNAPNKHVPNESKVNEVQFEHDGEQHEVFLVDDGTLDTVIEIDGREIRFDSEYASNFRKPDGSFDVNGLVELAIEELDMGAEKAFESLCDKYGLNEANYSLDIRRAVRQMFYKLIDKYTSRPYPHGMKLVDIIDEVAEYVEYLKTADLDQELGRGPGTSESINRLREKYGLNEADDIPEIIHTEWRDERGPIETATFYLVTDASPVSTLGDVIAKVDMISLANIIMSYGSSSEFQKEHPALYPSDQKLEALKDAQSRMQSPTRKSVGEGVIKKLREKFRLNEGLRYNAAYFGLTEIEGRKWRVDIDEAILDLKGILAEIESWKESGVTEVGAPLADREIIPYWPEPEMESRTLGINSLTEKYLIAEGKFKKWIKQAYKYYDTYHDNYVPDADDIWNTALEFYEDDLGADAGKEVEDALWKEVSGERREPSESKIVRMREMNVRRGHKHINEQGMDGELPANPGDEKPEGEVPVGMDSAQQPAAEEEPKKPSYSTAEEAEAQIRMDYPEEPLTSTALAYADSIVDDPKVYGAIRNLDWDGIYTNKDVFLKQAKVVGNYNKFDSQVAKRVVDKFGDSAKYKLGREGSVVAYITVRDSSFKASLEGLKDLFNADELTKTSEPGEIRIWWD